MGKDKGAGKQKVTAQGSDGSGQENGSSSQPKTWADVAYKALEMLWRVIDGGHLCSLGFFVALCIIGVGIWRMDSQDVGPVALEGLKLLASKITLGICFACVEGVTLFMWKYDHKVLCVELKRVGDEKSWWVHNDKKIAQHTSSGFDWKPENDNVGGERE